ncbi:MAG: hypothetical protein ACRCTI_08805, partial [Beijerinckiaceae bacterium]
MRLRERQRSVRRRPVIVRPLMPWLFGAGLLVSFTASAGIRGNIDDTAPGLRFSGDPLQVSVAWPTLTPPDIAVFQEDFLGAPPIEGAPTATAEAEEEGEPHLAPGLWRGAQVTDGAEALSEATPEISVLFRLSADMLPAARSFEQDDGGPIIGAFSGFAATAVARAEPDAEQPKDTIVIAKAAPAAIDLPRVELPPAPQIGVKPPPAATARPIP